MLTVDDYGAIRRARRDGKSIRRIAFDLVTRGTRSGMSSSIRSPVPNPKSKRPRVGTVSGRHRPNPGRRRGICPKQRRTTAQVCRRLRDEHGYHGCYGQVQRYLRKHHRPHRETFIPLGHLPGQHFEADFGGIYVDFPDGRRRVSFLVAAWAYSNAPFVIALPCEPPPKRSSTAWSPPSSSLASIRGVVGTTPKRSPRWSSKGANVIAARSPRWPVTTSSTPVAACPPGQREARRRGDRQGRATPLRHPRAPRGRSRRVEPVFPQVLRGRA